MYGNLCFEKAMENVTIEENCYCPVECNAITYSFNLVSTPFDVKKMCLGKTGKDDLMNEFYQHNFPHKFLRRLIEFKDNVSSSAMDYCKKNIPYRAEVVFTLETNSMPVTVISRRLSFFDKMSAFGEYEGNAILIKLN